ncbi:MAG: formimidoylglutamase [Sphingobacteriaceae bacterium]|nr:formimidoylglutamase [Sphingobacteriaceae bacterium]
MDSFKLFSRNDILMLVSQRDGETKIGEQALTISNLGELSQSNAQFVLLGIPEDIGVRANGGIGGAKTAFQAALKALLNLQENEFLTGKKLLLLGYFEIEEPLENTIQGLRKKVSEIDILVMPIIEKIVAAGKIPIVIGGGHNNAYPIIAGTSKALKQAINTINIDAHADLRTPSEGRHSGNGFSLAIEKKDLKHYSVFGLHQNYNNQNILDLIAKSENIKAIFFDDLLKSDQSKLQHWLSFISQTDTPCGLEIDLDSIENILSSAQTPSGFTLNEVRSFVLNSPKKFTYLHLCEGAIQLENNANTAPLVAKAIAYLISDFVKVNA